MKGERIINDIKTLRDLRLMSNALVSRKYKSWKQKFKIFGMKDETIPYKVR